MKILFKPLLVSLAGLLLAVSLFGCSEKGGETASQENGSNSSVFQSQKEGVIGSDGTINFYLPAGTGVLEIKFDSSSNRIASEGRIEKMLAESGINIEMSNPTRFGLYYQVKTLKNKVLISLPSVGVKTVIPYGLNGMPSFEWNYVQGFVSDSR